MAPRAVYPILISLALAGAALPSLADQGSPPQSSTYVRAMPATQRLYDGYVAKRMMAGISGAFSQGGHPATFISSGHLSWGEDSPAADPDSLWRVYSMTKPITAMAAMVLIDEGKLELDEPVYQVLPAFRDIRVQLRSDTLESRPAQRPITIRHLLTHTSGLGYDMEVDPLRALYVKRGIIPYAESPTAEYLYRKSRPTTLQDFANRVASVPLVADPGTKWHYSIGLDVLAAVVEKASGMPFEDFVQQRIFDPLDMKSSYWAVPGDAVSRLTTNYAWSAGSPLALDGGPGSAFAAPPSFPYGGAGLIMSARDYDRFLQMLEGYGAIGKVRILRTNTAKLAMSNLLPAGIAYTSPKDPHVGFGAGGYVALPGTTNPAGPGTFGWSGAAGSQAWVNPDRKQRGVIMVNYFPSDQWPVLADTRKALVEDGVPAQN